MKFLKTLSAPKKAFLSLVSLLIIVGIVPLINFVQAEWYPNRPAFDYNKPCNPDNDDPYDRCGSMTGPVFNSFINTPSYGDERAFVDARKSENTASGSYKNVLEDVTEGSREVVVRMYVHNNANVSTNESGLGIARNTRVRLFVPTAESQTLRARGYISADNATPQLVEDTVDFVGAEKFKLEYVPGSAIMYNNGAFQSGVQLSDSIVSNSGALIGNNALDGNLPGCFEYEAVVQVRLRVIVEEPKELDFEKHVRKAGDSEWKKEVSAVPGDKIEWLLTTRVSGGGVQNNIIVRDRGVPNNQLETGSVRWIDAAQGTVAQDDGPLFDGGINFGNYTTGGGFYVMFSTVALGDFEECQVRVRNLAYARSDQVSELEDYADVVITREDCEPEPVYSCDLLTAERVSGRTYRFTTAATARNGAEIQQYVYTFGDDSNQLVTDKDEVEHTYAEPGRYVASVVVRVNVNGQQEQVEGDRCVATVNVEVPPAPAPQPTVPGTLPVTGMGSLIGIFTSVSIIGGVAHSLIIGRRQ
jgi:hypothetical protein